MENRKYIVLQVSPDFPLSSINANVMHTSYPFNIYNKVSMGDSTFFINNGNIYCQFRVFGDGRCEETYMCCSVVKLKRFAVLNNIKDFISWHGEKEQLDTIGDLYEIVINCGFTRKIDYDEYYEASSNLKSDFSKRYKFKDFNFVAQELNAQSYAEDVLIGESRYGIIITLDMVSERRNQSIPDCLKGEIEYLANNMLEENLIDNKDAHFLLQAEMEFKVIRRLFREYRVHIVLIDRNMELCRKTFYLCDCTREMESAIEQYFKNELFPDKKK